MQGADEIAALCVFSVWASQQPSHCSSVFVFFIVLYNVVPAVILEADWVSKCHKYKIMVKKKRKGSRVARHDAISLHSSGQIKQTWHLSFPCLTKSLLILLDILEKASEFFFFPKLSVEFWRKQMGVSRRYLCSVELWLCFLLC